MQDEQWRKLRAGGANGKGDVAMNEREILALRGQALRRDDRARLQGAGSDAARRSAVYAFLGGDRHEGDLAAVDAVGQDQVQKRQLHRPQGARDRRGGARHGRAAIEAEIGGQPRSLKLLFLNAWAKTPQGWKFVAWQSDPARGLSEGFKGRADLPVEQPHQLRVGHQSEDCERPRANDYSRGPVAYHLWRLAVCVGIIEARKELRDCARLALGCRPVNLAWSLAMITAGIGFDDACID